MTEKTDGSPAQSVKEKQMKIRKNFRECPSCDNLKDWEEDEFIECELQSTAAESVELSDEEAWKEEFGKICPLFSRLR